MKKRIAAKGHTLMYFWGVVPGLLTALVLFCLGVRTAAAAASFAVCAVSGAALCFLEARRRTCSSRDGDAFVLWFTGLSGSGKSTIADRVFDLLAERGIRVEKVDGDAVREVFPQTGFTRDERNAHIRRMGFLVSLLEKNGVSVVASFISPYRESRDFVRGRCSRFIEVFVDANLEECEKRDVKGLYRKAREGKIPHFTGIDDPYEPPEKAELVLHTGGESIEESTAKVMRYLSQYAGL